MTNEKKNSRKLIVIVSIVAILVIALGVTYAFYTYSRNGTYNNKLIAGDIYMRYKEGSAIDLSGAMPSSTYPSSTTGNYYEFQIIGKNTNTTKDITYNVKLAHGDPEVGKTRIPDQHLVFKLVEVVNNEEQTPALVEDQSYQTIPGTTIYTATIAKNTTNERTRTFRLYARISENVGIGTDTTFTTTQWNNLFASIKINVDGGFVEGGNTPVATPANCFSTSDNGDGTLTITGYNGSCGGNVVIPSQIDVSVNPSQSSNKKNNDNLTQMPNVVKNNNNIVKRTDNNNLKTVTAIGNSAFKCYNGLCGNFEGSIFVDDAYAETSMEYYGGISYNTGDAGIYMSDNDLDSIVNTLVIPDTVVTIGHSAFYKNNITTLVIPDSVETIGTLAFFKCSISNLDLGNGVQTIGTNAFMSNSITSLTLPSSLTYAPEAFLDNSITNLIFNSFNYEYPLSDIFAGTLSDPIGFSDQGNVSITLNMTEIPETYFENYDNHFDNISFDITLANNLSSIGSAAFNNQNINFNRSCEQLESMENYPWGARSVYGNNVQCNID